MYEIKCIQSWNDSRITHLLLNQWSINQFWLCSSFYIIWYKLLAFGHQLSTSFVIYKACMNFDCVLLLSNTTVITTKFTTQQKLQNTDAENEAFLRSIKILYCIEQWCSPIWGPFVVHPVVTYRGIHEHRCCQTPIIQPACHLDLFTMSCEWYVWFRPILR